MDKGWEGYLKITLQNIKEGVGGSEYLPAQVVLTTLDSGKGEERERGCTP